MQMLTDKILINSDKKKLSLIDLLTMNKHDDGMHDLFFKLLKVNGHLYDNFTSELLCQGGNDNCILYHLLQSDTGVNILESLFSANPSLYRENAVSQFFENYKDGKALAEARAELKAKEQSGESPIKSAESDQQRIMPLSIFKRKIDEDNQDSKEQYNNKGHDL
jgi:hypothetical protein